MEQFQISPVIRLWRPLYLH